LALGIALHVDDVRPVDAIGPGGVAFRSGVEGGDWVVGRVGAHARDNEAGEKGHGNELGSVGQMQERHAGLPQVDAFWDNSTTLKAHVIALKGSRDANLREESLRCSVPALVADPGQMTRRLANPGEECMKVRLQIKFEGRRAEDKAEPKPEERLADG